MNAKERDFAYKVRNALNHNLDQIPDTASRRLTAARHQALARRRLAAAPRPMLATRRLFAGAAGSSDLKSGWFWRVGVLLPVIVLIGGLAGIYLESQSQRLDDLGEIDALVLSDELPISAYADRGFNAFLAKQAE